MIEFLLYLGSGKLLLVFIKKFPPTRLIMSKWKFLDELYNCNMCFGFWVYLFLAPFFKLDINMIIKNEILGWIILACLSTYLAHVITLGHEEQFGKLVIEDAFDEREST